MRTARSLLPLVTQFPFPEYGVVMNVEIQWKRGERTVAWINDDQRIVKEFDDPLRSVAYLDGPPSIVIVESVTSPSAPRNAAVYNLDGTERVRLQPPPRLLHSAIGFDQVFQSATVVEAVFATRAGDFHGDPDLVTGEIRNVNEWR